MREKANEKRDEMVVKVREKLYQLVQLRGVSQRRIEQQNGFTRGYLSQVLKGHITLTMRHVFGILYALDIEPEAFFSELFENRLADQHWIAEVGEKIVRYDAAMRELEDKGMLTPTDRSVSSTDGGGHDLSADVEAQAISSGGKAAIGEEEERGGRRQLLP